MVSLGLASDQVRIVAYDPGWPEAFAAEAARIREACAGADIEIRHVGSTAVPGMAAKPILDIMIGVKRFAEADGLIEPLVRLGYRNLGNYGIEGRVFFRLNEPCTHHVHVCEIDGTFWNDELTFRDALRESPDDATRYVALKKKLARRFANDRPSYTDAKGSFITSVLERVRRRDQRP